MKTIYTPTFRFSGYPLEAVTSQLKKEVHIHLSKENELWESKNKKKPVTSAEQPENWDESWFANYE